MRALAGDAALVLRRAPVPVVIERVVSATPAAFARDLAAAWPGVVCSPDGTAFSVRDGALALDIELVALPARRLGALVLPQVRATYRFSGGDAAARAALLARLDRAMQCGGG